MTKFFPVSCVFWKRFAIYKAGWLPLIVYVRNKSLLLFYVLISVENKRFAGEEDECLWSTLIAQFATKDIGSDYDADVSTDDDDSEYDTNDDSGSIGHGSNTTTGQ